MFLEVVEAFVEVLFMHGVIACLGRLALLALYVVGIRSIWWGNPLGPLAALAFVAYLLYRVGHRRVTGFLLQPDLLVWEESGCPTWAGTCAGLVLCLGLYCPFVMALMYNTPLHGAWMIPLPTAVMGLQRLVDRRRTRRQPKPATAPATSVQRDPVVCPPIGEPSVQVHSSSVAVSTRDCPCSLLVVGEVESCDSCGC